MLSGPSVNHKPEYGARRCSAWKQPMHSVSLLRVIVVLLLMLGLSVGCNRKSDDKIETGEATAASGEPESHVHEGNPNSEGGTQVDSTSRVGPGIPVYSNGASESPALQKHEAGEAEKASAEEKTVPGPIRFSLHNEDIGIDFVRYDDYSDRRRILESTGGGVAALDFDRDGQLDLVLIDGCRVPGNPRDQNYQSRIYRNREGFQFSDATDGSRLDQRGYGQGCSVGDYDADGFDDLYVTNFGRNALWRNNGDGTFTEVTDETGVGSGGWSTSCAFADVNSDGILDLYVANYLEDDPESPLLCPNPQAPTGYEQCPPSKYLGQDDVLYLGDGKGSFRDVTEAAGLTELRGKALGVVIWDFDRSGLPEIFVCNDGQANFLLVANGVSEEGVPRYFEQGLVSGVALNRSGYAQASMGVAAGDIDQDGNVDLILTHFYGDSNTVYRNQGGLQFEDATRQSGLAGPSRRALGWGAVLEDFNGDQQLDFFVANGHVEDRTWMGRGEPFEMPAQVFLGQNRGIFEEVSKGGGGYFSLPRLGRGVASGDFDGDGRIDLAVSCQGGLADILQNESPTKEGVSSVSIQLVGVSANRQGIGAWVELLDAEGIRIAGRGVFGGGSYASASDLRVNFSIPEDGERVRVFWPGGDTDEYLGEEWGSRAILVQRENFNP